MEIKYFRHYYNERENYLVEKLVRKHGATGYGVYWYLLEELYFSLTREFYVNKNRMYLMAMNMRISRRKMNKIFGYIVSLGLVDYREVNKKEGIVTCERVSTEVKEILDMLDRRRNAASIAGKASAKARRKKA